ncbi:MAG: TraR/DksA C4-type zinc finger protein [Patescibacteria group bacterium]
MLSLSIIYNVMNDQQLQQFKLQLEAKKAEIIKHLDAIGTRAEGDEVNFNADFPDYGNSQSIEDNASEVSDYATNLSLEHELEDNLHDVEKALKKIVEGTYGKCKHCGKEIEAGRLAIRPESTSCVSCKKSLKGQS